MLNSSTTYHVHNVHTKHTAKPPQTENLTQNPHKVINFDPKPSTRPTRKPDKRVGVLSYPPHSRVPQKQPTIPHPCQGGNADLEHWVIGPG